MKVVSIRGSVGIENFVELPMPYEWSGHDVTDLGPLQPHVPLCVQHIANQNKHPPTIRNPGTNTNSAHLGTFILARLSELITPRFCDSLAAQPLDGIAIEDARTIAHHDRLDNGINFPDSIAQRQCRETGCVLGVRTLSQKGRRRLIKTKSIIVTIRRSFKQPNRVAMFALGLGESIYRLHFIRVEVLPSFVTQCTSGKTHTTTTAYATCWNPRYGS